MRSGIPPYISLAGGATARFISLSSASTGQIHYLFYLRDHGCDDCQTACVALLIRSSYNAEPVRETEQTLGQLR